MNYQKCFWKMNRDEQWKFIENLKQNDIDYNKHLYNQDFAWFENFIWSAFNMMTSNEGLEYLKGIITKYQWQKG